MTIPHGLAPPRGSLQARLRFLYEGEHPAAYRFRYALLAFDAVTVLFIVVTSFAERSLLIETIDVVLGLGILADFTARLSMSRTRLRDLLQPTTWADFVAVVSFLAPLAGE